VTVLTLISDLYLFCARHCVTAAHFSAHYLIGKNTATKSAVGRELLKHREPLHSAWNGADRRENFLRVEISQVNKEWNRKGFQAE